MNLPRLVTALAVGGERELAHGRHPVVARQLGAASELAPHDPTPVVRLGRMHLESGRPELARGRSMLRG